MNLSRTFVNATKEREDGPFAEIETLDRAHTHTSLEEEKRIENNHREGLSRRIDRRDGDGGRRERKGRDAVSSSSFLSSLLFSLLPRSIFSSPRIVFDRDVIPFFLFLRRKKERRRGRRKSLITESSRNKSEKSSRKEENNRREGEYMVEKRHTHTFQLFNSEAE